MFVLGFVSLINSLSRDPATTYATTHQTGLRQLVLIMQGMWGTLVEMELQDHL